SWRVVMHESIEAAGVRCRNVEKEERWCFLGQRRGELAIEVAVDLDHRHQQSHPKTKREDHGRCPRPGRMDMGDGEPQYRRALARQASCNPHRQYCDEALQHKYAD